MKKILVRSPHWLGDAIVTTIFIRRLKHQNPDSEIWVLSSNKLKALFQEQPEVARVLVYPNPYSWQVFSVVKLIRKEKFDEMYVLPRSARTPLEAWFSRVPKRIGFGGDARGFLFTDVIAYDKKLSYAHRYLKMINEESLPSTDLKRFFPHHHTSWSSLEKKMGFEYDSAKPLLGLAPTSIAPARTWLNENFIAVANRFYTETQGLVFLLGSPQEHEKLEEMKQKCSGPVINTAKPLNLGEVGWLLRRLSCLVANDSGMMHVAAACNTPTLVVFGASDPAVALPAQPNFKAIHHTEISCVPCYRNKCFQPPDQYLACLKAATADEIWQNLKKLNWRRLE